MRMNRRSVEILVAVLLAGLMAASCSRKPSAAYLAACEGPPLRNIEQREKAMQDGLYNRMYDCIDKESVAAQAELNAKRAAFNAPEAIAQREAERAERIAEYDARRAAEAAAPAPPPRPFVPRPAEINTATETELASVPGVGPVIAAQIIEARKSGRFNGWPDVVRRVVGLSAAQTAGYASVGGLTVDGESLVPPDSEVAAFLREKLRAR
jgi:DNA uptake protein ComE-like DNA-binding protein